MGSLFVIVYEPRIASHVGATIADNLRPTRLVGSCAMARDPIHSTPYDGSHGMAKRVSRGFPPKLMSVNGTFATVRPPPLAASLDSRAADIDSSRPPPQECVAPAHYRP